MCPAIRHPDSPRLDDPTGRGRPGPRHTGLPSRRQVELGRSVEPGEIKRFSNRHSCRLETHLNPCAPTKPLLLIVTQSPLFCAQIPTTKWAPAALAPRLDDPFRIVVPSDQREPRGPSLLPARQFIPNRNIPLLEALLTLAKPMTSKFLIATSWHSALFASRPGLRTLAATAIPSPPRNCCTVTAQKKAGLQELPRGEPS